MELQQILSVASAYGAVIAMENEGLAQMELAGLAYDSRKVRPGYLFVAIPGSVTDGHKYIDAAVGAGAIAVVAEREPAQVLPDQALIITENSRHLLGRLAATYYGHPEQELRLIGVTGTNGKTTTTHLIKYLLETSGLKSGLVGTIHNKAGLKLLPATHTTPESLELFELFALMRAEGCRAAVMEVSSHALAQGRTASCEFSGAVFTNLSQDHLDYHGTYEEYRKSKALLFAGLRHTPHSPKYGVVNVDDAAAGLFVSACAAPVWTYGSDVMSTVRLTGYQIHAGGSQFRLVYQGEEYEARIPLIGKFNVYNALAALTCAVAEGIKIEEAVAALARAPQVPGRFELVEAGQDFTVVVDYAHTPDGLENVLSAARELKPKRLISVFGCGGNRDSGKRPLMGRVGASLSDVTIITTDNPRHEDPLSIITQIKRGADGVSREYLIEADRAKAIQLAINMAEPGDMVVIAGKGHENYQIIGDEKHNFNDREQARNAIKTKFIIHNA